MHRNFECFLTLWIVAHQAPLCMEVFRQESCSRPFPSPGDLLHPRIKPGLHALQADFFLFYCGQESLRRHEVALIVNKIVQNAVLRCSFKNNRIVSVCFQDKPFNITAIKVYAPITEAEEAEVDQFYEHLQHLLELTLKKMSFSS